MLAGSRVVCGTKKTKFLNPEVTIVSENVTIKEATIFSRRPVLEPLLQLRFVRHGSK